MGHDYDVHKKFYRMPTESIEKAKITKLIYLSDNCKMSDAKGLNLNEVDSILTGDQLFKAVIPDDYDEEVRKLIFIYLTYVHTKDNTIWMYLSCHLRHFCRKKPCQREKQNVTNICKLYVNFLCHIVI